MNNECWLPALVYYDDYGGDWTAYQDALYTIFKADFLDDRPYFEGKVVSIRKQPIEYGKEEAFFHVTCQDYLKDGKRVPDFRRCERISWVRSFIEEYQCDPALCDACDGIKVWREPYKSTFRVHLLFEEEQYIVILEPREKYCLLITAFYIEYDHSMQKQLKNYARYK